MKRMLAAAIMAVLLLGSAGRIMAKGPADDLQQGIRNNNSQTVQAAVDSLTDQNDEKAFNSLNRALLNPDTKSKYDIYTIVLSGLARFTNPELVAKVTRIILTNKNRDLGKDMLAAMKSNRSEAIIPLLAEVLGKGTYEMKTECIHQLGSVYSKKSLEALFDFLRTLKSESDNDKPLIKEVIRSLKSLSGIDRGYYPESWLQWWDENRSKSAGELVRPKGVGAGVEHVGQYRDMSGVETLPKEKVIVVRNDRCDENVKKAGGRGFEGNYDRIQDTLTRLGIAHKVVGKSELESDSFDWDNTWAIVFNCNFFKEHCCNPEHLKMPPSKIKGVTERTVACPGQSNHQNHSSKLSEKTIKKIRRFVETGGYLFTEDLNIEEIIERAFKKTITHTKYLPERVVTILPAPGMSLHPYLKYVFEAPPTMSAPAEPGENPSGTISVKPGEFKIDAKWKIDDESPDIKILSKDVTVLMISPKLRKEKNGRVTNQGAVAVTWGVANTGVVMTGQSKGATYKPGGRVLHVMSHFGKQKSKADEFALQNLILNFFIELNERRPKVK